MVNELTKINFDEVVKETEKPVLVDFWAGWCGPCRMMGPVVDQIADELVEDAVICKVNVDEENELAKEYGIMTIPTLMIFKNGEVVETFVGVREKEELIKALK